VHDGVLALTLPRHGALRARLTATLDPGFLLQQLAHGALDWAAVQRTLAAWLPQLNGLRGAHKGLLRWAVDIDPLAI
jgi:hypothetical protein